MRVNILTYISYSSGVYFSTSSVSLSGCHLPGPAGPFSLKTVHWTVFRALEPPQGEGFWGMRAAACLPLEGKVPPQGADEVEYALR